MPIKEHELWEEKALHRTDYIVVWLTRDMVPQHTQNYDIILFASVTLSICLLVINIPTTVLKISNSVSDHGGALKNEWTIDDKAIIKPK